MGNRVKLVINGVPPWDGEYEFESFADGTNREYNRIKDICGVRAGELIEALSAGDTGAWVAFTVMIPARHGKDVPPDTLWDAPENAINFDAGTGDDAGPPTVQESNSGSTVNGSSSGASSESTLV